MKKRLLALSLIVVATLAGACSEAGTLDDPVIDREAATQSDAVNLTIEEAGFLASGQFAKIYGSEADPVAKTVTGQDVDLDGQRVWRLDITVDVIINAVPTERRWRIWVGTPADGPPGVLKAQEFRLHAD